MLASGDGIEGGQNGQQLHVRVSSAVAAEFGTGGPNWLGRMLVKTKAFEKESKKGSHKDNNARDVGGGKCDDSAVVNGGDGDKSPEVGKRLSSLWSKVRVK